jgi:glucose-6-phosphate 1-dehydrogenase
MYQDNRQSGMPGMLVIFGGTGDLTHRKLMPALYNLCVDGLLPENFITVSVGRRDKTDDQYRDEVRESLEKFSRNRINDDCWGRLRGAIHYFRLDIEDLPGYKRLGKYLDGMDTDGQGAGGRIYYLAVAPEHFEIIVSGLHAGDLAQSGGVHSRLVIEKPFGKDLATAETLNSRLLEVFPEESIYRIDHYLGKEMIQNIMVLRFCNTVFESLWSGRYIDNIQISLSERHGVGTRGGYYEQSGAMRDMVQNHAFQILSLVAMEPPGSLETEAIRAEKVKAIRAIEPMTPDMLGTNVVFGQYDRGMIGGKTVPAYREEDKVAPDSTNETFVALHINNFRWAGTPFYIRTGKRMKSGSAQIVVQFKALPDVLYFKDGAKQEPNLLVIRIQPDVGVLFQFNTKDSGTQRDIVTTKMDTCYACPAQGNTPEAYERLLYDILRGDATLFSRWDEVEASWKLADSIIAHRKDACCSPNYAAGTMGPQEADALLARDGHKWRDETEEWQ